jgi:hypothetical protein
METIAVREGIKLACDLGLALVDVETDANEIVSYR